MRGISEERLRVLLKQYESGSPSFYHLLRSLEKECQELNPWQPIDENTPKDREILTWSRRDGKNVAYWSTWPWVESGGSWLVEESRNDTRILYPTHWLYLPPEPELP